MAEIRPFKGFYYDTSKVDLQKVATQPWDVITPKLQERYYAAHPYNIVRIIRGKEMPGDNESVNKFTRAGSYFREWMTQSVFVRDTADCIYLYSQKFRLGEREFTRRGFVAAVRLEDYESKVILPHEHTFPSHNADRLSLFRQTRANFGQIFLLYPDPETTIPRFLARYSAAQPLFSVTVDGVTHSISRITDPGDIAFIVEQMRDKQLFIADGHHRYQTALNYRDETSPNLSEDGRREVSYRMMTLVSMDDPSVVILPTHRAVRRVANFGEERILSQLRGFFDLHRLERRPGGLAAVLEKLTALSPVATTFVLCLPGGKFFMLRLRDKASAVRVLPGNPHPAVRELDVTILHSLVLQKILSLSPQLQESGEHVAYFRNPAEAIGMVEKREAQVAFLLNPTRVSQVREVALAGQVMPHKSTDFYPKLLTGLIMRKLDI